MPVTRTRTVFETGSAPVPIRLPRKVRRVLPPLMTAQLPGISKVTIDRIVAACASVGTRWVPPS